ncbi:hypothetical protein SAMN05216321_102355 [Cupriavidus sp. OV038]|nr:MULTISPECIES: hypothetical protein [unclassified Cupriavidus]SFB97530.1 hypothetical protein SAMN05216321_102355 [Cupriavidus sp. OV038]SFO93501.1 hypothetical protein SAMN05216322_103261 [Cupriavidus sp. OV096]
MQADHRPRSSCSRLGPAGAVAMLAMALLAGCASPVPRDINGSPATARLMPNGVPPAPITPEESQSLTQLNQQILRDQEAAIARQQQAEAWAYAYPNTNWSLYYGGWGGGRWGGGVGVSSPGYWGGGWGGYPYGW